MDLMKPVQALAARFRGRSARPDTVPGHFPERRQHRRLNARKGTRVLIIDDSETAQMMITRMFTSIGYVALQSRDPDKGLMLTCAAHPDLVILDVGLPGMNGFEVLRQMRRDPLARRIPVIMVSGNPQARNYFRHHKVDADGFIQKPFTRSEMFLRIEKMLNKHRVPKRSSGIRLKHEKSFFSRLAGEGYVPARYRSHEMGDVA